MMLFHSNASVITLPLISIYLLIYKSIHLFRYRALCKAICNIKLVSIRCNKIGMMSWSHTHENIHLLWLSGIGIYFGETLFSSKSTRAWYIWANLWSSALASLIKLFFSFGNIYLFGERSGNTNVNRKVNWGKHRIHTGCCFQYVWVCVRICVCVNVLTFQSMSITGYCHLYSLVVLHVQNS